MANQRIWVEIDALLDTRIGTLSVMAEQSIESILKGDYYTRETDQFSLLSNMVDDEVYVNTYTNRNKDTLKSSYLTHMVFFLKEFISRVNEGIISAPMADRVVMDVNVHPYSFSNEERELLDKALCAHVGIIEINIVSVHPMHQVPNYFKGTYQAVFMYNYLAWFNLHHNNLLKHPIPDVAMYIPKLMDYGEAVEINREKLKAHKEATHLSKTIKAFDAASIALTGYVNLQFLDVETFSLLKP